MSRHVIHVIHVHTQAPTKPAAGDACNGCGVCCSWRPCPLGAIVSGRLSGPCAALRWHEAQGRYRCGMVEDPAHKLSWLPAWLASALAAAAGRLARRWIAAGAGCDSNLVTQAAPPAV